LIYFREQSEDILQLKGLIPGGTLPLGTLGGGKSAIEQGRRLKSSFVFFKSPFFSSETIN
jgi:hypothetical protein